MGHAIEPPPEYGDDCEWAVPEFFEPGTMPKYIVASFNGVWYCPYFGPPARPTEPAYVGDVLVTQSDVNPCEYYGIYNHRYFGRLQVNLSFAMFGIAIGPAIFQLFKGSFTHPSDTIDNIYDPFDCPLGRIGYYGSCALLWKNPWARFCWTYGLIPIPYPLAEPRGAAPDGSVVRFCHPSGKTNIKIKYDSNLYEIARPD